VAGWSLLALAGRIAYNADQLDHQQAPFNLWQYVGNSGFWTRTLQNWSSEFLAVLLAGALGARQVVEQQRAHRLGRQPLKLGARPVDEHASQPSDLAVYARLRGRG
jgi:uncharacterized protein DUF6766